jgi:hypothetical protein
VSEIVALKARLRIAESMIGGQSGAGGGSSGPSRSADDDEPNFWQAFRTEGLKSALNVAYSAAPRVTKIFENEVAVPSTSSGNGSEG